MEQPLISVITPTYKAEQYLDECVESILAQTHRNLELILVDDGSPDRSGEICDKWGQMDNRVKVIHKNNGGASSARNMALDIAQGEYVTCVDADDYIAPDTLERLLERMTSDIDIVIGGMYEFEDGSNEIKRYDFQSKLNIIHERLIEGKKVINGLLIKEDIDPTTCGKLYRKELFENLRFIEGRNNEDKRMLYFMGKKMAQTGQRILILNEAYYFRRNVPTSISHSKTLPLALDSLLNWKDYLHDSRREGYAESKEIEKILNKRIITNYRNLFISRGVHKKYCKSIIKLVRSVPTMEFVKGAKGLDRYKSILYIFTVKYLVFLHPLLIKFYDK